MSETEENFSPQQSLQLIQSMIHKTRVNLKENSFYFLLWGWVSFSAVIAQFILKVVFNSPYHFAVWSVTLVATVITIVHSSRRHRSPAVRTFAGDSLGNLWMALGLGFFIYILIMSNTPKGYLYAWPVFILFYGLGTFVSGKLLQFRPLVIGGAINFGLSIGAIYVPFDYQLLIGAGAILASYIIPGYLLRGYKQ